VHLCPLGVGHIKRARPGSDATPPASIKLRARANRAAGNGLLVSSLAATTRKRKKHAEEFKREAVRLLETRGERTVADVSRLARRVRELAPLAESYLAATERCAERGLKSGVV
jgi:hypothetical protein